MSDFSGKIAAAQVDEIHFEFTTEIKLPFYLLSRKKFLQCQNITGTVHF
ncbi:hypothetical protein PROVRUST_06512 [Providencia rustigianii DSM 4541]|uniref:Uncharacterized protein n=1 Tax=Providencia rustigianii DSM 4541 TaxID=500637 RepID=D1P2T5_9GAMM|nr:hypothetical protein PROVRUST_06512 [Providencia rustigianii DSM 4541]